MTREELLSAIAADSEINVIASAVTAWHAMGVEAWILSQQNNGRTLKGFVLIESHPVSGCLLSEKDFPIAKAAGLTIVTLEGGGGGSTADKLKRKAKQYGYYLKTSCAGSTLYYLKPVQPDYDLIPRIAGRKVVAVMLDEGLGSYTNTPAIWLSCVFKESGTKEGIKAIYSLFVRNPFWKKRLTVRKQLEEFVLLQKKNGHFQGNPEVAACYRKVLETKATDEDLSRYEGAVVINTDVNAEAGNIREDEDIRAIQKVCDWCKENGVPVILKPHPREKQLERYEKLPCYVDVNCRVAQEVIFASLKRKPLCTVSMASTTLVSSKVFFGISGIALNRLMNWDKIRVEKDYVEVNRLLEDFVTIPENEKELREALENMRNCK